jgi:hypothetical protein
MYVKSSNISMKNELKIENSKNITLKTWIIKSKSSKNVLMYECPTCIWLKFNFFNKKEAK